MSLANTLFVPLVAAGAVLAGVSRADSPVKYNISADTSFGDALAQISKLSGYFYLANADGDSGRLLRSKLREPIVGAFSFDQAFCMILKQWPGSRLYMTLEDGGSHSPVVLLWDSEPPKGERILCHKE